MLRRSIAAVRPGMLKARAGVAPIICAFLPTDPPLATPSEISNFLAEVGAPRLQAGDVRRPRRGRGARHRAGRDAETDRKIRGQAGRRAADAVLSASCRTPSTTISAGKRCETRGRRCSRRSAKAMKKTTISTRSKNFATRNPDSNAAADPARSSSRRRLWESSSRRWRSLPARQREAFLLRYWEELDVAEAAAAMGCSEGSVKTHCSRAVHALAEMLKAKGLQL